MPSNVNMIFGIIIPIVMFDFVESEYSSELILDFDYA